MFWQEVIITERSNDLRAPGLRICRHDFKNDELKLTDQGNVA